MKHGFKVVSVLKTLFTIYISFEHGFSDIFLYGDEVNNIFFYGDEVNDIFLYGYEVKYSSKKVQFIEDS